MKTTIEPYRRRMVEPKRMTTREERERFIREAGYNPFLPEVEQVLIDLVTDSGVSALSTRQWSAMHGSDESFTGSRCFHRFREAVRAPFGHGFVIPCHQGRAAGHLLARAARALSRTWLSLLREALSARSALLPTHKLLALIASVTRALRVLLRDVTVARSDKHCSTTEGKLVSGEGSAAQLVNHSRASASVAQALVCFAPDAARNPCRSMFFRPVMPMTAWRAFLLE